MRQVETRIKRLWHTLEDEASSRDEKVDALAELRLLLAEGPAASRLTGIKDAWWLRWANAFLAWSTTGSAAAEPSTRELVRLLPQAARRSLPPDQSQMPKPAVAPDLLFLAANGLLLRCLADGLLTASQTKREEPERTRQLAELRKEATAAESRIRGWGEVPMELDVLFAKGVWRFHESRLVEAGEAFQTLLAKAAHWGDAPAGLEARLWLALALDRQGRGQEALNHLHDALTNQESTEPASRRQRRLLCLARAHRARLCRHLAAAETRDQIYRSTATGDLHEAEQLAEQLQDPTLLALVHDFRGDLLLALGDRPAARQAFLTGERHASGPAGSERAVAYARYSQAKWLLAGINPVHQVLDPARRQEFEEHLGVAESLFRQVGDEAGLGMAILLRAQAEMCANPGQARKLFKQARKQLRTHGPRRHLALALFRRAELGIAHRSNPVLADANPISFLRQALSMVQRRLSMPDRLALFREGLKQLPVDEWIDLLLQFAGEQAAGGRASEVAENLRSGVALLAHDYSNLLQSACDRLGVLAGNPRLSPAEIATVARAIQQLVERLRTEVNSLAGGTTIGVEVSLQPVSAAGIVNEVVLLFQQVGKVPVDSRVPEDLPDVQADPTLLRRVMFNLLMNAQKAIEESAPALPQIVVQAAVRQRKIGTGSFVELTVNNSGNGIPEDRLPHLFEKGWAGFRGGTGLGLYFCRQAMGAMDGAIYVKDPGGPGRGPTFGLRLRRAARAARSRGTDR